MSDKKPDPADKTTPAAPRKILGREEFFDVFKSGGNSELFAKTNPKKVASRSENRTGPIIQQQSANTSGPTIAHAMSDAIGPSITHRMDDGSGPSINHSTTDASGPSITHRMDDGSGPSINHSTTDASGPSIAHRMDDGSGPSINHSTTDASGPSIAHRMNDGSGPSITHPLVDGSGPSITHPLVDGSGPAIERIMADALGNTTRPALKNINISASPINRPRTPPASTKQSVAPPATNNPQQSDQGVKLNSISLTMSERIAKLISAQKETNSKMSELEKDSHELGHEHTPKIKPKP